MKTSNNLKTIFEKVPPHSELKITIFLALMVSYGYRPEKMVMVIITIEPENGYFQL